MVDLIELLFKEQYISRSDMWRLSQIMIGDTVQTGKKVERLGMRIHISCLWKDGKEIQSGIIQNYTKFLFRSATAIFNIFVQMSCEMWDYDPSGTLYFERAINDLLTRFFKLWKTKECSHDITIIFFSRTYYNAESYDQFPPLMRSFVNRSLQDCYYQDFYWVIMKNEKCEDWVPVIKKMLSTFQTYEQTTLGLGGDNGSIGPVVRLCPHNSDSASGNLLEMINLSLNVSEKQHLDCNFERTGQFTLIISPGHGIFNVDRNLSIVTKERVTEIGLIPHVVCLGEPPLCTVPLFKFLKKENEFTYGADFVIPFWLNISFYLNHPADGEEPIFISRNYQVKRPNDFKKSKRSQMGHIHSRSLLSIDQTGEDDLNGMTHEQYDHNIFHPKGIKSANKKGLLANDDYKPPSHLSQNYDVLLYAGEKVYRGDNYHTHTAAGPFKKRCAAAKVSSETLTGCSYLISSARGPSRSRKKCNSECATLGEYNGGKGHLRRPHASGGQDGISGQRFRGSSTKFLEEYSNIYGSKNKDLKDVKYTVKRVKQLINPFQLHSIPLKLLSTAYHKWNTSYQHPAPKTIIPKTKYAGQEATFSHNLFGTTLTIPGDKEISSAAGEVDGRPRPLIANLFSPLKLASSPTAKRVVMFGGGRVTGVTNSNDGPKPGSLITNHRQPFSMAAPPPFSRTQGPDQRQTQISSKVPQDIPDNISIAESPYASTLSKVRRQRERMWKPHIKIGLDWNMIGYPACLPLTVDFVPDALTLRRDYIVSDYFVLAEYVSESNETLGCWELLDQLLFQRLRFGGQIVKDLNDTLPATSQTSSLMARHPFSYFSIGGDYDPSKSPTEYLLNIGRAYHVLTVLSVPSNTIKITIYKPRHSFQAPTTHSAYNYNLRSPEHDAFQRCRTSFKFERAVDDFLWNTLDMYLGGAFTSHFGDERYPNHHPTDPANKRVHNVKLATGVTKESSTSANQARHQTTGSFVDRIRFNRARFLILPNPDNPDNSGSKDNGSDPVKARTSFNFWSGGGDAADKYPYNWYHPSGPQTPHSVGDGLGSFGDLKIIASDDNADSTEPISEESIDLYDIFVARDETGTAVRPPPPPRSLLANGLTLSFLRFVDSLNRTRKLSGPGSSYLLKKRDKKAPISKVQQLTTECPLQSIAERLATTNDLVKVYKESHNHIVQGYQWYYVSYQLLSWIYHHVEGVEYLGNALKICQDLCDEGLLRPYSEQRQGYFMVGTHLYALHLTEGIIPHQSPATAIQERPSEIYGEDQAPYLEIEVPLVYMEWDLVNQAKPQDRSSTLVSGMRAVAQDLSISSWIKTRKRIKFSEHVPLSPPPVASIASVQKEGRRSPGCHPHPPPTLNNLVDKVHLHYMSGYRPDVGFELGLEWLSATPNHLMDDLIRNWARKASSLGLHMAPALDDPFSYAKAGCDRDPLRLPVFIPIKKCFMERYEHLIYYRPGSAGVDRDTSVRDDAEISPSAEMEEDVKLRASFVDFMDWVMCSKFGFIKHLPSTYTYSSKLWPNRRQHRYNYFINESSAPNNWCGHHFTPLDMEYVHFSGGMFVSFEVETITVANPTCASKPPTNQIILGLRWSWNFLLTKKWRLPTFSEERLLENTFSQVKAFCQDPADKRLYDYFDEFYRNMINI